MKPALPTLSFAGPEAFAEWLAQHHASSPGVWLKLAKKGASMTSVSYAEAIEVALCWGWIDGQKQGHGERHWLQKFTPRGVRSLWSKINRDKATALIGKKKMMAPGLAEVERAQRDGRWEAAYDSPKSSTVPADLQAALDGNARARRAWATIDSANRYAILWRVQTAKKAETRARRIAGLVAMLGRGELLHPERRKKGNAAKASRSR
jgi:uncharacterized protein YdeI (YjbR/CyaY-like superfamily)